VSPWAPPPLTTFRRKALRGKASFIARATTKKPARVAALGAATLSRLLWLAIVSIS
jgi:hypothetical protein